MRVAFWSIVVIGLTVWFLSWVAENEARLRKEWYEFVELHHCKVVGKKAAQYVSGTAPTISANGNVGIAFTSNTIPAQTGWECDDGITYWNEYKPQ